MSMQHMPRLASAVVALLSVFSPAQSGYFPVTTTNNYRESEKICQSNGGVLASFHDDSEYAYAQAVCQSVCNTYDAFNDRCGCWVGLLDWGAENNFKWQDRSEKDYVMTSSGSALTGVNPWFSGEPNNYGGYNEKGEDCVHIWKAQAWLLNDISCRDDYFAVCEDNVKEYFSIQSKYDYRQAAKECREEGGVLASFHDDDEWDTAQTVCEEVCSTIDANNGYCGCWVGLKDLKEEDDWHWEDQSFKNYVMLRTGKPTPGTPWYPNEPNDWSGEDCVHIWRAQGYLLNDIDCDTASYYAVCTRYVPNRLPLPEEEEEFLVLMADDEEEEPEKEEEVVAAVPVVVGEQEVTSTNAVMMIGIPALILMSGAAAYACYSSRSTGEYKALLESQV